MKEENEEKIQLLLDSLRPAIVGLIESRNYNVTQNLTKIDYCIIKELLKKPRMDIIEYLANSWRSSNEGLKNVSLKRTPSARIFVRFHRVQLA